MTGALRTASDDLADAASRFLSTPRPFRPYRRLRLQRALSTYLREAARADAESFSLAEYLQPPRNAK